MFGYDLGIVMSKRSMRGGCVFALAIAGALPAAAQTAAAGQDQKPKPPFRVVWSDYPSIRAGVFRLDVHAKWQGDSRRAEQDLADAGGTYETGLKRLGVAGRITNRVNFEVERELRKDNPWRNVFVNVEFAPALELRGGKFKMPFSYEELTGATHLDFVYRSQLARIIAPAREVGVMAHGRLLRRIVEYQAGWFNHDGENASLREPTFLLPGEPAPQADHSIAGRVAVEPLRHAAGPRELRRLYLGVAFTQSKIPEGLNSLRGKSLFGNKFFEPVYVRGDRRRFGTEAIWLPGPVSIKTEYARSNEQRKKQGLLDDDISDFVTSGWYVSGTWLLTGERKDEEVEPRKPLFQKGFGAVEVGARYDTISFGSMLKQGTPFDNPRADPLLENPEHIWTLGVNWYVNKWVKVVVNGVREAFDDPDRTIIPGKKSSWAGILRLQFVM